MIPLAVHSYYSLMWGVNSPAAICATAKQLGYRRLALTDTDNLYGLWPFLRACEQESIIPLIGATVTEPESRQRVTCLVKSQEGYANLCQLITKRHCDSQFDLLEMLAIYGKGLVMLSSDSRLLTSLRQQGFMPVAALSGRPTAVNHRLLQLAVHLAIPVAAVPDSFFLQQEGHGLHRLLRAIDQNRSLSSLRNDEIVQSDAWLAAPKEYINRFAVWPEAIHTTYEIAERCSFTGPSFGIVLPSHESPEGFMPEQMLRKAAYEGARTRYGDDLSESVVERLEHELRIIGIKGFSSYFLVVRDIVNRSSLICGRGSGAASLVAYCLYITNVCPMKHSLYFERFLNPGRDDPPDIDIDFAWDERDAIIDTVLQEYQNHVALVCNHVSFKPRMAVREVARTYGLPDREISRITKKLPWHGYGFDGAEMIHSVKKIVERSGADLTPPWPEILNLAADLIGTPRNLSVHPGGVIITPRPLSQYVPIERAAKGVPIIQWEKDGAEEAGLVKIDLLGNRSLGVIRDAICSVQQNSEGFDFENWEPEDDEQTKQTIAAGRTMGCFYIESPAMRLLEQKAGTGDFEQLVLQSSIIRPAANDCIKEYLRRLHGGEWFPLHPLLKDVLDETFGIMVYQEDVSRVAVHLAGFSHSDADGLRKIMSKKDKDRKLRDYKKSFFAGAGGQGVSIGECEAIWKMIMSFSGYSFCKPHSASYARVSFQAAYLKTHYKAEFMAAVISNQGGFYTTFAYVSEAKRLGITILPPDVNRSAVHWTGRRESILVGLMAIKSLGRMTQRNIVKNRQAMPYRSAHDFFERILPDEDEARSLIHAGALDEFVNKGERSVLLWELAYWQKTRAKQSITPLFDGFAKVTRPELPPQRKKEQLRREFEVLGFLCDYHPLEVLDKKGKGYNLVTAANFCHHVGRKVQFAGWLITGKKVSTKHGEPMEFLTFEDETGLVESIFFPESYNRFSHILEINRPFLLSGLVEEDFGAITFTVDGAKRLQKNIESE